MASVNGKVMIKRIALSLIGGVSIPFLFWAGGFNFERGDVGLVCAFTTLADAGLVYSLQEQT